MPFTQMHPLNASCNSPTQKTAEVMRILAAPCRAVVCAKSTPPGSVAADFRFVLLPVPGPLAPSTSKRPCVRMLKSCRAKIVYCLVVFEPAESHRFKPLALSPTVPYSLKKFVAHLHFNIAVRVPRCACACYAIRTIRTGTCAATSMPCGSWCQPSFQHSAHEVPWQLSRGRQDAVSTKLVGHDCGSMVAMMTG